MSDQRYEELLLRDRPVPPSAMRVRHAVLFMGLGAGLALLIQAAFLQLQQVVVQQPSPQPSPRVSPSRHLAVALALSLWPLPRAQLSYPQLSPLSPRPLLGYSVVIPGIVSGIVSGAGTLSVASAVTTTTAARLSPRSSPLVLHSWLDRFGITVALRLSGLSSMPRARACSVSRMGSCKVCVGS
jgi:hypothetical protein